MDNISQYISNESDV